MNEDSANILPFSKAGYFAFPLVVLIIIMEWFYPTSAPEGYKSFIIAFEFAQTPEQIHTLLQGMSPADIRKVELGNFVDFAFMVFYTSFLIVFARIASKTFAQRWLLIGIPLSIIILFADIYENILLLQILDIYSPSVSDMEISSILKILHIVTWVKWGGLTIIFAGFSTKLLGKKLFSTIEGIVCIIPLIISIFALSNDPVIVSWFTLSIFIVFFVLLMFSFTYREEE